jgi:hypothetical protein
MPIDWPEPFGLVMIEAMRCGTPVIAFNRGSVPEVIDDGLTGFIVEDEASAVAAVGRLKHLDRAAVRARFEQRFTARRMARDYLEAYRRIGATDSVSLRARRNTGEFALPKLGRVEVFRRPRVVTGRPFSSRDLDPQLQVRFPTTPVHVTRTK